MVIALNMLDEAARIGLEIDGPRLQQRLGVTVMPLVASKGRGVRNLFVSALRIGEDAILPKRVRYARDLEEAVSSIVAGLDGNSLLSPDALAIKLLEEDPQVVEMISEAAPNAIELLAISRMRLQEARGQEAIWVVGAERHGLAGNLVREVVKQGERRVTWRDRLDSFFLHPIGGYLFLFIILLLFFEVIYGLGSALETPLLNLFLVIEAQLIAWLGNSSLIAQVLVGSLQGVAGGVAIVLPYLMPFLLGLGLMEDIGYLPRVAFLMDGLMHRIGLHGKAVVPFILGYGCNVPAVMSTRLLEERRDRFLAAALATLVPCAARLAVVFGLVAFYLGPRIALGIYIFNLFVIALTGKIISSLLPEDSPGLIMEMPIYRLPTLRTVTQKAWFRIKEFIVEAWPILILGSVVLAILNYYDFADWFNLIIRPITWALGLPGEVGVPLIFGILRKELSLIMLRQALGVSNFASALSPVQMITFTVFVVFYVPCLATLAVLRRELGNRDMLLIAGLTVIIAFFGALAARVVALLVM